LRNSCFNIEGFQDINEARKELCKAFPLSEALQDMIICPHIRPMGEDNCSQIKASFRRLRHCWLETAVLGKDFKKNTNAHFLREWMLQKNNWEALKVDRDSNREWVSMLNEFRGGKLVECYSPCQLVNELSNHEHSEIAQMKPDKRGQLSAELNKIYNQKVKAWKCEFEESADALEKPLESLLESFEEYRENQNEEYFRKVLLSRWECFSSKAKSLYEVLKVLPREGVLIP